MNKDLFVLFQRKRPKALRLRMFPNWEINYPAAAAERSTDFDILADRRPIEWDISILSGYFREELGSLMFT